jgi:O-antigen ligase
MTNKYLSVPSSKDLGSYLLILYGFTLPLSVAINNILLGLIIVYWLFVYRDYKKTFLLIKKSKVLQAFLLFFILHIIGLIWTEDLKWGLHIIKKEGLFLLAPIFMTFVKKDHIKYYIASFLLAMSFSELLSYLIWFHIIPPIFKSTVYDPTPFMSHISYNPFLAVSIYIIGYYLLFRSEHSLARKAILFVFFITMSCNMFITGGRAGQVAYVVTIFILSFQYFKKNRLKAILVSSIIVITVFGLAYFNSKIFHDRIHLAVSQVRHFDTPTNTSVGLRINFALNTLRIIQKHPILGVGTGDFKSEYSKINSALSPTIEATVQPHNMYLLEAAQFGIFGLLALLYIFYSQIGVSLRQIDPFRKRMGLFLPIVFMVIMLSDSYLLGHYTTALFVYMSSILYKPDQHG